MGDSDRGRGPLRYLSETYCRSGGAPRFPAPPSHHELKAMVRAGQLDAQSCGRRGSRVVPRLTRNVEGPGGPHAVSGLLGRSQRRQEGRRGQEGGGQHEGGLEVAPARAKCQAIAVPVRRVRCLQPHICSEFPRDTYGLAPSRPSVPVSLGVPPQRVGEFGIALAAPDGALYEIDAAAEIGEPRTCGRRRRWRRQPPCMPTPYVRRRSHHGRRGSRARTARDTRGGVRRAGRLIRPGPRSVRR